MNNNLTDITVVMDRSGSMHICKEESEHGLNKFIDDQRKCENDCVFTLVQFDTQYEFVHTAVPIKDVPKCILEPRGATALLDAVGRAIDETGDRLSKISEDHRPGLVVFVILTDGLENSSKEFTKDKIKDMIQRQEGEYKWEFTYLGANQDSFEEAGAMGMREGTTSNFTAKSADKAWEGASGNVSRMRSQASRGMSTTSYYTDEEKANMNTP